MKRAENEHYHHKPKDLSRLPAYAQKYPSLERSHLCDVKRSTLNPAIPTFRMKDMDDVLHKLTDTHCRHTTLCSADCFEKYSYVSHDPTHKVIRRDYCIEKLMKKYSFDVNKLRNPDFDILKTCPPERKYMEAAMSNQKFLPCCVQYDPYLQEEIRAAVTSGDRRLTEEKTFPEFGMLLPCHAGINTNIEAESFNPRYDKTHSNLFSTLRSTRKHSLFLLNFNST